MFFILANSEVEYFVSAGENTVRGWYLTHNTTKLILEDDYQTKSVKKIPR